MMTAAEDPEMRQAPLNDFLQKSSIHGLNEIECSNSWILKFVWTLVVVVGISMMCYEIKNVVTNYIENPIGTAFANDYTETYKIPNMLICPQQWIDEEKVDRLGIRPAIPLLLSYLPVALMYGVFGKDSSEVRIEHEKMLENAILSLGSDLRFCEKYRTEDKQASITDLFHHIAISPDTVVANCRLCSKDPVLQRTDKGVCYLQEFQTRRKHGVPLAVHETEIYFGTANYTMTEYGSPITEIFFGVSEGDTIPKDSIIIGTNSSYQIKIEKAGKGRLNIPDKNPCESEKTMKEYKECARKCSDRNLRRPCDNCTYLFAWDESFRPNVTLKKMCSAFDLFPLTWEEAEKDCHEDKSDEVMACAKGPFTNHIIYKENKHFKLHEQHFQFTSIKN